MGDIQLDQWMKEHLPKGKETFSRDAVEILLTLLWKEAKTAGRREEVARREYEKYADHDL